jgi:HSP20 family protein
MKGESMANIVPRRDQPAPVARRFGEWDPFERMRQLMQWDPFQELPRRWFGEDVSVYTPRFDVREENDAFVFKADLPGIKEDDVDISVTGNRLTVSGKREEESVKEAESYYCRERSFGSFARSFTLPDSVNTDQIQADMHDGVLSLRIPKSPEAQPKKIPLKVGNGGERATGNS